MPSRRIPQTSAADDGAPRPKRRAADDCAPRPKRRAAAREAESKRDETDAIERSDDSAADEQDEAVLPAARRGKFDTSMCKPCAGCSGKAKVDCEHRRCLKCCMHFGRACAGHRELIRRREEENRLLNKQPAAHARAGATAAAAGGATAATAGAASGSPVRGPRKAPAMTTTIWCLRDFLANRAFSEDILNAQRRARRVGSSDRKLPAAAHGARRDARLERALERLRSARA